MQSMHEPATDALLLRDRFLKSYRGPFGPFTADEGSDAGYASASSPDGESTTAVVFEICADPIPEFASKKQFIESKRKRLGPMGKLKEFVTPAGFDESYGGILNYHLLGKTGGFFFYTGRKGDVVIFIQAYHTAGKETISDADRDGLIQAVFDTLARLSHWK
ncbi:hypothetical protein O8W32_07205 [Methanomassiliicoccales archaeon LGM-DZ1]|nr:hypothetical protein O8W32_07205 [Methanomassiliicoccales archaeon LGM-DZ1]